LNVFEFGCLLSFFFFKGGAKINSSSGPEGRTPLMLAAQFGHGEMCSLLVALGADINVTDSEGVSAGAMWSGGADIAAMLGNKKKRQSTSAASVAVSFFFFS
jgi:ankyrin repeat protein